MCVRQCKNIAFTKDITAMKILKGNAWCLANLYLILCIICKIHQNSETILCVTFLIKSSFKICRFQFASYFKASMTKFHTMSYNIWSNWHLTSISEFTFHSRFTYRRDGSHRNPSASSFHLKEWQKKIESRQEELSFTCRLHITTSTLYISAWTRQMYILH